MEQKLTRVEVARVQLDRALLLFLSKADYISAITLAGAAEEILGKLAEQSGQPHALDSVVTAAVGSRPTSAASFVEPRLRG